MALARSCFLATASVCRASSRLRSYCAINKQAQILFYCVQSGYKGKIQKMSRVELLSDRLAAAHLDRRRNRELQRQERIFNPKVRTIGIDEEALQHQVQEKRFRQELLDKELKDYTDELIRTDRIACLLESRQQKDERLLAEAIVSFHQQIQKPSSRREFDLNDPEWLKKQEGVRILPGLPGEDLDSRDRTQRQREQLRDWTLQQQQELDQAKELQRLRAQQYDQSSLTLDNRAIELQKMEEEDKRATNIAVKNFNQVLAAELRERKERERRQDEENDQTEILNHLQGTLLNEDLQKGIRAGRECYKGMTSEQTSEFTKWQSQQAEEKRRVCMEQMQKQLQEHRVNMASVRAALLQERQQARTSKQLRRAVDETNRRLAQAQHAQRMNEVYTNIPDESFFSQFNTCSR